MRQKLYLDENVDSTIAVVYQQHAPKLITYLRLHLPLREDAEDILVDIFVAAMENQTFSTLEPVQQRQWLWRVAHNKVADYYRLVAHKRHTVTLEEITDSLLDDDELAPEWLAERSEEHTNLQMHVQGLPEIQQKVLHLRFVNGLRCADIARMIGKREGNVRMILSRTLNLLRSIYERH
ncbi:RNA polymerase sigma factor [Dictyobacter alpinus]|nr:sigma-70 family RNA polymerase sigma factor [Dictyobacter alpinus]